MRSVRAAVVVATLLLSAAGGAALAGQTWLPVVDGRAAAARYGYGITHAEVLADYPAAVELGAGWYHGWNVRVEPERPGGIEFVQVINLGPEGSWEPLPLVVEAAERNPGSIWLLGNEIDIVDQNPCTPEEYAAVYHTLRSIIKRADPTAIVAPGSVTQWTPSRRVYLERVLAEYRRLYGTAMPVDLWNIHAYILPEDVIGLPVGVEGVQAAWVGEVWRHTDVATFQAQVTGFRAWLDANGYVGVPFMVSEYGVLFPASDEVVSRYMAATMRWMESSGLVERWAWFSLNWERYPGVLVDGDGLTEAGRTFAALTGGE